MTMMNSLELSAGVKVVPNPSGQEFMQDCLLPLIGFTETHKIPLFVGNINHEGIELLGGMIKWWNGIDVSKNYILKSKILLCAIDRLC